MKTIRLSGLMLLAVFMSFGMIACGDDDDDADNEAGVDTNPISLIAGYEKTIQGADTISPSNEFVAYGKGGTVHAWHVGETELLVNGKKRIPIVVKPAYYLYNDPVLEWGCTIDHVKSLQKQGTLSSRSNDKTLYYENAGAASVMAYTFENGKLKNVVAVVSTNHTSQYASFLAERYLMLPLYEGEETYFMGIDGLKMESAKTVVLLQVYSVKYLAAVYGPVSEQSTRSSSLEDVAREKVQEVLSYFFN